MQAQFMLGNKLQATWGLHYPITFCLDTAQSQIQMAVPASELTPTLLCRPEGFYCERRSMASPRLFLKCVPALSPHIDLRKNKDFAQNLRKHSILYRVLQHILL